MKIYIADMISFVDFYVKENNPAAVEFLTIYSLHLLNGIFYKEDKTSWIEKSMQEVIEQLVNIYYDLEDGEDFDYDGASLQWNQSTRHKFRNFVLNITELAGQLGNDVAYTIYLDYPYDSILAHKFPEFMQYILDRLTSRFLLYANIGFKKFASDIVWINQHGPLPAIRIDIGNDFIYTVNIVMAENNPNSYMVELYVKIDTTEHKIATHEFTSREFVNMPRQIMLDIFEHGLNLLDGFYYEKTTS